MAQVLHVVTFVKFVVLSQVSLNSESFTLNPLHLSKLIVVMQFYFLPWVFTLEHFCTYFMVGKSWIGFKYNVMMHTAASSKAFVLFSDPYAFALLVY